MSAGEFFGGVAVGLAATVVWVVGTWLVRRWPLVHDFGYLAGKYEITRKLSPG